MHAKLWTEYFMYIISFNFHNDPLKQILISSFTTEESDTQGSHRVSQ